MIYKLNKLGQTGLALWFVIEVNQ